MSNINDFMAGDAFAHHLGIVLTDAKEGHACAQMEICAEHLNALKMAQGGVLFTLGDLTLAAAANSYGRMAVSVNCAISFIKPAAPGMVYAEATEISRNHRLGNYEVRITNPTGEIVAQMTGIVYFKKENI